MNTDATPSWSGYIFQGEVALCRAIETMNGLGNPIPDKYCLRLEEDEDFSIQTDKIEVFQVKAYLSKDADKISKYKTVIEELINKYYYFKRVEDHPTDGRKKIHTYYLQERKKPVSCALITDKVITDYQTDLANFGARFSKATASFQCEQGVYTLGNIHQKLMDAVKASCANPHLSDEDIYAKVSHCCLNITRIIKQRHATKRKERISFKEIKQWIDSPLAFSEDLCWYEISKIFLKVLSEDLEHYDLSDADQAAEHGKLQNAIDELENIPYNDLVSLIRDYTTPHKTLEKDNLRQSFGSFLEESAVQSVVVRALRELNQLPFFKYLQYTRVTPEGQKIRYQLLNHNTEFDNSLPQQTKFQKHCEKFYRHPNTLDVDFFVTRHVSKSKEEIRLKVVNILNPMDTPEQLSRRLFGFVSIDQTINDINP